MIFWDSIKDNANPDDFKEYLKKYPDGEFADLGKNRLKKIEAEQPKAPTSENTEPEYWRQFDILTKGNMNLAYFDFKQVQR